MLVKYQLNNNTISNNGDLGNCVGQMVLFLQEISLKKKGERDERIYRLKKHINLMHCIDFVILI